VASTAGGVIALQLSLTRLFSLVIWYHFAFLAISLAMLGLAVGATVQRKQHADAQARCSTGALIASGSTLVLLLAVPRMRFALSVLANAEQFALFLLLITLVIVPFAAAGAALSTALTMHRERAGTVYSADLIGSGLAGCLSVFAMDHLGGGFGGASMSAALFALAALGFSARKPGVQSNPPPELPPTDTATSATERSRRGRIAGAMLALLGSIALAFVARNPLHPLVYTHNAKVYPRIERSEIYQRKCTSLACVDFFHNPQHFGIWGLSTNFRGEPPEQIGVVIDGWALTSIPRTRTDVQGRLIVRDRIFDALPPAFAALLRRSVLRPARSVLVVGAGGGMDVRAALHHGALSVDAIELNPSILQQTQSTYAQFSGPLYRDPRVRVIEGEGRSVLEHSQTQYDLLQLSGVDTYAASQAGAFALTENYLYTEEAITTYLQRLAPGGTLTLTRWLYHPDRQTIRLVATLDQAFARNHIGALGPRLIIAAAPAVGSDIEYSVLLVQREPFTAQERFAARVLADIMRYRIVWADDGGPIESPFREYFSSANRREWVNSYPWRITATTDDSPFFFEHTRWSRLFDSRDQILGVTSGQLVLLSTFALLSVLSAVLLWTRRKVVLAFRTRSYFLLLGLGFMFVESALIPQMTLCLGHPVYALTVVLTALLVGAGVGSALTETRKLRAHYMCLVAACVVLALSATFATVLPRIARGTLAWRFVAVSTMVAALGAVLGTAFPLGLRRVRAEAVATCWLYNAVASSVGGALAMMCAIEWGFRAVLAIAAVIYLCAALVSRGWQSNQ
jgi:SAM-dependent methyltransferase